MASKKTKFYNQLNKSAAYVLLSLCLVLVIFYFSILKFSADLLKLESGFVSQFTFFYILFSISIVLLFLIFAVGANRMIYAPLEQVLGRIQSFRQNMDESSQSYFHELPDFWNEIELEVLEVVSFLKKRGRQSERIKGAIQNILNVFPEPTLVVNRDGDIKYRNYAFDKVFSVSESQQKVHISNLLREPQILSLLDGSSEGALSVELDFLLQDGKRNFIVFKTPYATRSEDGEYDILIIFHDITSQKRTEQMKTSFVSNVSHELRTPLMAMQGYLQVLRDDLNSGNLKSLSQYADIIEANMSRLSNLVNDLLELSVLESDSSLQKASVCTKDLTAKVLSQFTADFEKGQYAIEAVWAQDAKVWGHERLIEQVLINFMQNALRYTPSGTRISIEWKPSGTGMELIFKDNGPGISLEHQSQIFERFYRVDHHRSRTRGGTGLGLSIVKHIVQRHGGAIRVSSQLGEGVEFSCYFPGKE